MKLICLFAQRREAYEGEYAPELLVAIDEYTNEENPVLFDAECTRALAVMGDEILGHAVINIEVSMESIRRICLNRQSIQGEITNVDV